MKDHELRGFQRREAHHDINQVSVDVGVGRGGRIASDEVGVVRGGAPKRAQSKEAMQKGADGLPQPCPQSIEEIKYAFI